MKRIFIMAALQLAVFATVGWSQKTEFGVKAGANFATFIVNENVQNVFGEASSRVGFQLGLTVDIPFTSKLYTSDFYLMTGLEISQKGFKSNQTENFGIAETNVSASANPLYLQLPLYFAYKIAIAEDMKFVPRVGPYLAYGLSGKLSSKVSAGALGYETSGSLPDVDLFGDEGKLKNFDYGLGIGLGFEYSQFGLYLGYELGLANLNKAEEGSSIKNGNLCVSLGYRF